MKIFQRGAGVFFKGGRKRRESRGRDRNVLRWLILWSSLRAKKAKLCVFFSLLRAAAEITRGYLAAAVVYVMVSAVGGGFFS